MLARKMHVKPGFVVSVVGRPKGVALDFGGAKESPKGPAEVVLAFAAKHADVRPALAAAGTRIKDGGSLWVAYPKAGQLGTDLDRDVLARALQAEGLEPVGQVALDAIWSALRVKRDAGLTEARRARGASIGAPKKKAAAPKKQAAAPKKKAAAPKKKAAARKA